MIIDYTFQKNAVNDIVSTLFDKNESAVLLVSPTGSGKTVIAGKASKKIIHRTKGKILSILNLQTLVKQTYRELEGLGVKVSVVHNDIMGDENGPFVMGYSGDVVITMPDTFCNVLTGTSPDFVLPAGFNPVLLWVDEAHKGTSETFQLIRNYFPDSKVLGTTATPYRDSNKEGEHLHVWYGNNLIPTISTKELIEIGKLVQPVYMMIDKNASEVKEWLRVMGDRLNRQTVVFTKDTDASFKFLKAFTDAGIRAEVVTSGTDKEIDGKKISPQTVKQRDEINARFESGETTVLISVNALCEGWNVERTACVILSRTVGNPALYDQMVGRAMRSWAGDHENPQKTDCVVMDFWSNIKKFGYVEDRDWSKEGTGRDVVETEKDKPLTEVRFNAAKIVRHVCCNCHKVYDLKSHSVCPNPDCNEPAGVKLETTVKAVFGRYFGVTKTNDIRNIVNFAKNLRSVSTKDEGLVFRTVIRKNKEYGHEVFEDDGSLTPEFSFIAELFARPAFTPAMKITIGV